MDFAIIIIALAINGSHLWSMKHHFVVNNLPKGTRILIALNLLSNLTLLVLTFAFDQPLVAQVAGMGMMITSALLFWRTIIETKKARLLAAFDEDLPHGLVTSGPYAYVRHPFYTSYILLWLGWSLSTWHILAIVPAAFMVTTFWTAARDEEAKFARTDMAHNYQAYMEKTGRFFPKLIK